LTYTDIKLETFDYLIIDYLFTIWQVSQTPLTIGQPSILLQNSMDLSSLGAVTVCVVWVT